MKTLTMDIKDKKKSLKSIYKFTLKHNLDNLLDNKITTPEYANSVKIKVTQPKVLKYNKNGKPDEIIFKGGLT